eukprot:PITA_31873
MDLDKAPGPDDFSTRFLQACWPIIEKDLLKMVQKSQNIQKIGGSTNSAFLTLIPKEKGANNFNRFRPISLCNTGYKLITKVIANRLKFILPKIIPENQGGFIHGRQIVDNFLLIRACISEPWIALIVNGRATDFFKASRGLRQGCPLSPLLFVIQASALSFLLDKKLHEQEINGLCIARGNKNISHASFVDDTLLLGPASVPSTTKFKEVLDEFS